MTYLLNNSELCTLMGLSGSVPTRLSPLYGSSDAAIADLSLLEKSGFVKNTADETLVDGVLLRILTVLSDPEVCVKLERTSVSSDACLCSCDGNIWCVHAYIGYLDAHMIGEFSSSEEACEWFDGVYIPDCVPSEDESLSGALTFSYDEWNLFMLTQFLFMRKNHMNSAAENVGYLSFDELSNPGICEFLQGELEKRGFPVYSEAFGDLLDPEFCGELCDSLCEKGVFEISEQDDATLISYTDYAEKILDSSSLIECIKISRSDANGTAYKTFVSSRKSGYTVMADDGNGIRVVAIKSIPFKSYLKI